MLLITLIVLAAGTLLSEDLTCITAGLAVRTGHIHWAAAIAGCFLGIYVGDLGLWLCGRLVGRRALAWTWLARRLSRQKLDAYGRWFDERAAGAILASRFLPGARLTMYFAAGALGRKAGRFALWTFVAALLWTPVIILLAASIGEPLRDYLSLGWAVVLPLAVVILLLIRIAVLCTSETGRARLVATVSRIWRWEFWPSWIFYAPVAIWIAILSLRYRGFATITAANPGIPHGGFVGESKSDIMSSLGSDHVSATVLVTPGEFSDRVAQVLNLGWSWPVILKPDIGQRGVGVRLARDVRDVEHYLAEQSGAVIVQPYHPGPFEAGIFYYRFPGETRGRVFSITDKQFPELTGDGKSTIETLIWRHPRYRMQAKMFHQRHAEELGRVLCAGERFGLAVAGNHCQGTLFRDGSHLWTTELESAIDQVARRFDGFCFGRFDVRYHDVEQFKAGKEFTVIELNGVTSESTNIYDPSWSLVQAYRMLFRQWTILFQIGRANRKHGQRPSELRQLLSEVIRFWRSPRGTISAD